MKVSFSHRAVARVIILWLSLAGNVALYGCVAPATATPAVPPTATPTVVVATPTTVVATSALATATPVSATTTPVGTAVPTVQSVPGGVPEAGVMAMEHFDCGSCHTIPGVSGASGTSAPSLAGWATKATILGKVPNTPDNVISFIQNPQAVVPGTTMPNLGVPEPAARNMAAYLFTLQ